MPRLLVFVLVVGMLAAGCMGSSSGTTGTPPGSSGTDVSLSRRAPWRPLLTLARFGDFQTRCLGARFATRFTAEGATERVRIAGVPQEGSHVLQPGQTWYSPLVRTRLVAWQISQATEPQTIRAVVSIRPSRCPYGAPTTNLSYGTASFNSR